LFYEEFVVYVSPAETVYKKRYVLAEVSTSGICGCLRRGIACAHRS